METYDVIIVGSGHAGAHAAQQLRQGGYDGSIIMVGRESSLPYERPPLSKDFMSGRKLPEDIQLKSAGFWRERRIELCQGSPVTTIDPVRKSVTLESGIMLAYGSLIWAAGGEPRGLSCPGAELARVHTLRALRDADAIKEGLVSADHITLVGGGYIGLELAASLRSVGKAVTLIEKQSRLLARATGPELADFLAKQHRTRGVDLRLGVDVQMIKDIGSDALNISLSDGNDVHTQMIVAGIGVTPSIGPLVAAGAAAEDGVIVDAFCRTSLADIFAIGDCAAHPNPFAEGLSIRLESVQNAHDQAATVASALCGVSAPYETVPRFWSSQYDLRLQTFGLWHRHDARVVRGDPEAGPFSIFYLLDGRIVAVDGINAVRDAMQIKRLVEARAMADPAMIADIKVPLTDL